MLGKFGTINNTNYFSGEKYHHKSQQCPIVYLILKAYFYWMYAQKSPRDSSKFNCMLKQDVHNWWKITLYHWLIQNKTEKHDEVYSPLLKQLRNNEEERSQFLTNCSGIREISEVYLVEIWKKQLEVAMRFDLFVDAAPRCAHDDTVHPQAETTKHCCSSSEETLHTWDDALPMPWMVVWTQKPSTSSLFQCMQIATVGLEQSAEHSMLWSGNIPSWWRWQQRPCSFSGTMVFWSCKAFFEAVRRPKAKQGRFDA
jgi:hypothetical protein